MTFKSKLEALYATRNHWQWLAITGSSNKADYLPSRNWGVFSNCACCEYTLYDFPDAAVDCCLCPLNSYAWSLGVKGRSDYIPCVESSPTHSAYLL